MPWDRSRRRATPSALSISITARRLFLNLAMSLIWAAMYSSRFRHILACPFDLPLTKASHSNANSSGDPAENLFLRPFLARRCSLVNSNALMVSQYSVVKSSSFMSRGMTFFPSSFTLSMKAHIAGDGNSTSP